MALELKQNLKTTQRLSLSMELKHSITILGLSRSELETYVSNELEKNPCLVGAAQTEASDKQMRELSRALRDLKQAPKTSSLPRDDSMLPRVREYADTRSEQSLHDHLFEQINLMRLSDYEMECIELLLQYIDDNGFLSADLNEIIAQNNMHTDDMRFALEVIQKCEPAGVGARNLQECLLLQVQRQEEKPKYVETILREHWPEFEKQNFLKIARAEKTDVDTIKAAFRYVREHLDPRPARQFGEASNQVVVPDVYVFKRGDEWICSLNAEGLPRLKLSKKYNQLFEQLKNNPDKKDAFKFLNENIRSAGWLLKALEDRNKTILRVTEVILNRQKGFFENGVNHLEPLTLKDVADELGLHESTISRSTAGKYLFSPKGLFELKYFFNARLESNTGQELANESIKQWVNELIRNENKESPLSDQEIADRIEGEKGVKIARRTVTKYREALGLLSSSKRAQRF